jgi:hypothetical protein
MPVKNCWGIFLRKTNKMKHKVYIHRTTNNTTTNQGEEPTVKEAYMVTKPPYLGTTQ